MPQPSRNTSTRERSGASGERTVALVDWTQVVEDFFENVGLTFEGFRDEVDGGWMFGYVKALERANVRTVLVCVSARVRAPERHRHRPTGAPIVVLPAPSLYRSVRKTILNPYAASVEDAAVDTRGFRRPWSWMLLGAAPYVATPPRELARLLRRERCDALLCQDYEHGRFDVCNLVARAVGVPVYATFQGGDSSGTPLERLVRGTSVRAADGLVVAAEDEASRVMRRYGARPDRIASILNPLDLELWAPVDQTVARAQAGLPAFARVVVWHGRVQWEHKGLDVLLDAWQELTAARDGDLRLVLVGQGADSARLASELERRRLPGVRWIGEYMRDRAALRNVVAAADVCVLTSRWEGFPVAPLEALACGVPVVTTDVAGIQDVMRADPAPGIVVPRGDARAVAAALGRLLDDDERRMAAAAAARARVAEAVSFDVVGRQLRAFLFGD